MVWYQNVLVQNTDLFNAESHTVKHIGVGKHGNLVGRSTARVSRVETDSERTNSTSLFKTVREKVRATGARTRKRAVFALLVRGTRKRAIVDSVRLAGVGKSQAIQ